MRRYFVQAQRVAALHRRFQEWRRPAYSTSSSPRWSTKTRVIDVDLRAFFDNVLHQVLLEKFARRVQDPDVMHLLKMMLQASGKKGVPQGGVISPVLSNLYLTEVDQMLERAKVASRSNGYEHLEYARYVDDLVILVERAPTP